MLWARAFPGSIQMAVRNAPRRRLGTVLRKQNPRQTPVHRCIARAQRDQPREQRGGPTMISRRRADIGQQRQSVDIALRLSEPAFANSDCGLHVAALGEMECLFECAHVFTLA